jgi:hypothetical protein
MLMHKVRQNWTKLDKPGQSWTKLSKVGQNWIYLQNQASYFRTALSRFNMSRAQERFRHAVDFLDHCNTNFKKSKSATDCCEWDNTVTMKLDASDESDKEYRKKFGVNFMDEDTLIIGDDMNNVLMVYQDENKVITEDITSLIHVLNKLRLSPQEMAIVLNVRTLPLSRPGHGWQSFHQETKKLCQQGFRRLVEM